MADQNSNLLPYKIVCCNRRTKYGIVASNYQDLLVKADLKFDSFFSKVVLEEDGTVVDAEYFETLPPNTCLMVLKNSEDWLPASQHRYLQTFENQDLTDGAHDNRLTEILARIKNDISYLLLLGINDLELLSEMDVDSFGDVPDKKFLEKIQEAGLRFLTDKRDAKDAIDAVRLLKTYYSDNVESTSKFPPNKQL